MARSDSVLFDFIGFSMQIETKKRSFYTCHGVLGMKNEE